MSHVPASLRERIDAANARVDLVALIGKAVTLRGAKNPRGKCPFHDSKSDSFAVYPDKGFARCWGCGWHGDALRWLVDHDGLSFRDALAALEGREPSAQARRPALVTQKRARPGDDIPVVDGLAMARHLWKQAAWEPDAVRTYLVARGVPVALLTDRRLADTRFLGLGPVSAWRLDRGPDSVAQAPALLALVRALPESGAPPGPLRDLDDWQPIGVHATFLAPDLKGKMVRAGRDGEKLPDRKMLGPVGRGGVWWPGDGFGLPPQASLFVGEGNETVLSGIGLAGCSSPSGAGIAMKEVSTESWGLAVLSLDNLQGALPRIRRERAIPLHDPRPSSERPPLCFRHGGPVIGLIDADMKPLKGLKDRASGQHKGEAVIEAKGGPVVRRTITGAERAGLCAALFTRAWRAAGCGQVKAVRPHMGQDFNDAVREGL